MSTLQIVLLFKEHPTRTTTTPFSKVRKENLQEVLADHIRSKGKGEKDRLPPKVFGGYHMTFERLLHRKERNGVVETWLIHHSDGDGEANPAAPGATRTKT